MNQLDCPFVIIQIPSNDDIDSVQGYTNFDDAVAAYESICKGSSLSILFVILEDRNRAMKRTFLLFDVSSKEKAIIKRIADTDQFHTLSVLARKEQDSKLASRRRFYFELMHKIACLSPTKYSMLRQYISK